MADDLDVEDLLEAPFKKDAEKEEHAEEKNRHRGRDEDGGRRKHHRRHSHRRSRSGSRSPHKRSRSKDRYHRHSRDSRRRRSRSRSKERRRRSRSYSPRGRGRGHFRPRKRPSPSPPPPPPPPREPSPSSRPITLGPPAKRPSPNAEPPSVEKDRRTVMCMQLGAKVSPHDLEEFFQKVGQVCDVKMISDRNSRRSKGIAYVEFYDENSVVPALQLTGQKLFGVPIIVQPTMAEKNRLAAQAENLKKAEGPKKLYVGSLHYSINEAILKTIFEPFGSVEKIQVMRDESGHSKGYAFVEFSDSECAERAFANMNGVELAGRPMKVNNVTERDTTAMEYFDGEDVDIGVGMTPAARAQLMAKLSDGHNAGLSVPQVAGVSSVPAAPTVYPCFMISNMFDPSSESEAGWENDIREDVLEECSQSGAVLHIHVDKLSQGNVYVKCSTSEVATAAFNRLNGRFFAGKQILVQYIPEAAYHVKFPEAQTAITPLQ